MANPSTWLLPLMFFLFTFFSISIAGDTLAPGKSIKDGESLVSAGGSFKLGFFSPGASKNKYLGIWFNNIPEPKPTVVWVGNRENPLTNSTGILEIANSTGNLILRYETGGIVWSSNASNANSNLVAQLLDSGNLVLRDERSGNSEDLVWQSFDYPTDTVLSGMKLGWDSKTGLNRIIRSWKSEDDPSPGNITYGVDLHGSPQVVVKNGVQWVSRSQLWNGILPNGGVESSVAPGLIFYSISNQDEITRYHETTNASLISRIVVKPYELVQVLLRLNQEWKVNWNVPFDQCDRFGACGPYGACNSNDSKLCHCFQGFEPKSPAAWNMLDGSNGCVRKTTLDCRKGDGFRNVSRLKLPDTSSTIVNTTMTVEDCRAVCLKNCNCTAYTPADIRGTGSGCIMWHADLVDTREFSDHGQYLFLRHAASEIDYQMDITRRSTDNRNHMVVILIGTIVAVMLLLGCSSCCIWKRKSNIWVKMKLVGTSITSKAWIAAFAAAIYSIWEERNNRIFREELNTKIMIFNIIAKRIVDMISTAKADSIKDHHSSNEDLEIPLFDLSTIAIATNHFSLQNKLGEGGFGPVYKGKLGEGQDIAVKRLSRYSGQGLDEFMNEVMLIAKLQHRNLVKLLGCCIQGEERMLIYEYMHNKSLDLFIFDNTKGILLTWQLRFHIIMGIARGLLYLHQDSRLRNIHRDLKASNILLDGDLNPKISDFGTARIFRVDQIKDKTKTVVGTYGYMSPEYVIYGIFSTKSDVFSFGVLVLEIVAGKKNRGVYQQDLNLTLLGHTWKLWNEGNSLKLLDDAIPSCNITEALRCIHVGLLCVQEREVDRPEMASVVFMLGGNAMALPPPKRPAFCTEISADTMEWLSSGKESRSTTELTVTMIDGR